MEKKNQIINYYTNQYCEDARLSINCDNRHAVEREVKKKFYQDNIKHGSKVLDVCAGTGIWTKFLKEKLSCDVTSCDIVPEHVDIMKKNDVDAFVADARCLSTVPDSSYDVVLINGACYHLPYNESSQAVVEAHRVLKDNGIIFVDYLSDYHAFIQTSLRFKDFLRNVSKEDIRILNTNDDMFYYLNENSAANMLQTSCFSIVKTVGVDGISRFVANEINTWDKQKIDKWVNLMYLNMEKCLDLSEHCIIMGIKK